MEGKNPHNNSCYNVNVFAIFSTLEERAQRLWSTKGLTSLDPSLLAKNKVGKATKEKEQVRHRELAGLEAQVYR